MTVWADAWNAERTRRLSAPREKRRALLVTVAVFLAAHLPSVRKARSAVLQVGGLVALDLAAWQFRPLAGLVAIGVSLFVLEWLTGGSE